MVRGEKEGGGEEERGRGRGRHYGAYYKLEQQLISPANQARAVQPLPKEMVLPPVEYTGSILSKSLSRHVDFPLQVSKVRASVSFK